ncbi:MAG TPA: circularly permuted type 2 ATP-grasp protein, partial [Anaeromyxobacter sp.]|nr:circularly permuted type 2 ATP-grasp protein [Anaeromyxobacter sp.]
MSEPIFDGYRPQPGAYDELFAAPGQVRPEYQRAAGALGAWTREQFAAAQGLAERALLNQGVTFSVYADQRGTEKIFPFCLVPRLVSGAEWARLERGLVQRVMAIEAFLDDVYGAQRILKEKAVPPELVLGAKGYEPKLVGVRPPGGIRVHVAGIDL